MKTIRSLYFFLLVSLIVPQLSLAVEGTCSWHGGVSCSAGSDWDGSAICKDGWRDSTEKYSDVSECTGVVHHCTADEYIKLINESKIPLLKEKVSTVTIKKNELEIQMSLIETQVNSLVNVATTEKQNVRAELEKNAQNGGMTTNSFNTAYGFKAAEIDRNLASKMIEYTPQSQRLSFEIVTLHNEIMSYLDGIKYETDNVNKLCTAMGEDTYQKRQLALAALSYCLNLYGISSHFDPNSEKCVCNTGYAYADGQCRSADYTKSTESVQKPNLPQTVVETPTVVQMPKIEEKPIKIKAQPVKALPKSLDFKVPTNSSFTSVKLKKEMVPKDLGSGVATTKEKDQRTSSITNGNPKKGGFFSGVRSFVSSLWK